MVLFNIKRNHCILPLASNKRLSSEEIWRLVEEPDVQYEEDPLIASDEDGFVPPINVSGQEESDIEKEDVVQEADGNDFDDTKV